MYVFEDVFKPVKITREGFKKSVPILLNKKIKIPFQALEGSRLAVYSIKKAQDNSCIFWLLNSRSELAQSRAAFRSSPQANSSLYCK